MVTCPCVLLEFMATRLREACRTRPASLRSLEASTYHWLADCFREVMRLQARIISPSQIAPTARNYTAPAVIRPDARVPKVNTESYESSTRVRTMSACPEAEELQHGMHDFRKLCSLPGW